ncbi:MAG: hypothetical protein K2L02_02280 [Clostridia bacterium]|nr:hypothetical protein [Clostridia bacterium]
MTTAKTKVAASSSVVTGSAKLSNGTDCSTLTQAHSLNFGTMESRLGSPITLSFGGYDWTVVYATTNTTAGTNTKAGDLIVTLWMNDNIPNLASKYSETASASDGNYPTNMYSTSYIRVNTLNAGGDTGSYASGTSGDTKYATSPTALGGSVSLASRKSNRFAKFTLSNSVLGNNSSLAGFLTMPKNVEYQRAENAIWAYNGTSASNLFPNEAWGNGTDGVTGPNVNLMDPKNNAKGWYTTGSGLVKDKAKYFDWSSDYLWLPSLTETGYYHMQSADTTATGSSLWGIPTASSAHNILKSTQPSGSTDMSTWCRSGAPAVTNNARGLTAAGVMLNGSVDVANGVRPALHLNLSAAWESATIEVSKPPKEFEKTYDGEKFDLTEESWYTDNASILSDSNQCTITYKKGDTILGNPPKDAGTYTVVIKLNGEKVNWADATSTSDKTREVTLKINPKELQLTFTKNANGVLQAAFSSDSDSAPCTGDSVTIIQTYEDSEGNTLSEPPTHAGTYTLTVSISNSNYKLGGKTSDVFEIDALRVKASFMTQSFEYTGSPQIFDLILQGGTTQDGTSVVTAALKENYGSTVTQTGDRQFTALNADKYKVTLTLTNKDDYVWDSTGKSDDTDIEFEITAKTIKMYIPSFTPSNWAITQGYKAKANVELPTLESGNTLTVILSAFYNGNAIRNLCAIGLDSNTDIKEFELATDTLSPNTYLLGITYDDPSDVNAKNYNVILDTDYSFTVKQPSASGGIIWRLMQGSTLVGNMSDPADIDTATFDKKITYNGKSFIFQVNADGLGYTVDSSYNSDGFVNGYKTVAKGKTAALTTVTNAGEYVTTVRLKKGDETAEYHIEWKIDKVKFDLSKVRWLDNGQISYNEKGMSVELDPETIPEGLTAIVNSITPATVGQTSTATVTFTVDDSTNYEVPVSTDKDTYTFKANDGLTDFEWSKDWTVVPAVIPVKWTVGMITVDGKKVSVEALAGGYDTYLKYVYYDVTDTAGVVPADATPLDEPAVVEGAVKYYVAEVSIKSNFDGKYVLGAGSKRSPVFEAGKNVTMVTLAPKKTAYPYTGQPVQFQFEVTQGAIAESAFEIVYYKGMLKQVSAPKDVGSYRAQIKLKSDYERDYYIDGDYTFDFTIDKAVIAINWDNGTLPTSLKLKNDEKSCITYEYSDSDGNTVGFGTMCTTPGTYNVRAVIKSAYQKNYIFDNDEVETEWKQFVITQSDIDNGSVIDPNDPEGNKQYVEFSLASTSGTKGTAPQIKNNAELSVGTDYVIEYFKDGEPASAFSSAGKYQIKITLIGDKADNYILINGGNLEYTIVEGEGDGSGTTTPTNGEGNNPSDWTIESILPIILSGISLVLIVVFTVMTLNNASAAKEAREKTKKLAVISYSVSPASLLMLFGLSYTNWWIVAGVLMGLALLMGIVAFMFKSKKKKAFAMLEEEQERIAEEKELARLDKEEQDKREMRMMIASMQNAQQPQQQQLFDYDMLQNMISSSIQALLPGLQQLQALPPASSDAGIYSNMPNPEADALREQLAAQEERMAQQQELLNQILENQQNYMTSYEEEIEDDTSWLGNSDELISLEESYGALSDDGRRAYYEVGSYIMNKPRTSQNDGRYAVLFKYRGRTVFKLAIKDDAPVLYYPAGNGREEIRVADTSSLERTKNIIDRIVINVDSQM